MMHSPKKRGSEYDDSGDVDDQQVNGSKKSRIEDCSVPSSVLHIRGIHDDAHDIDVASLAVPFGLVSNMVFAKRKAQALLEMDSIEVAKEMVQYYSKYPPTFQGRRIAIQFSTHETLKCDEKTYPSDSAVKEVNALHERQMKRGGDEGGTIVRFVIDKSGFASVGVDVLYKVFSKHGRVLKIVSYTKNNQLQGFVEFGDELEAKVARISLQGRNIYNDCCTLILQPSKLTTLEVKPNSRNNRDFELNPMTRQELNALQSGGRDDRNRQRDVGRSSFDEILDSRRGGGGSMFGSGSSSGGHRDSALQILQQQAAALLSEGGTRGRAANEILRILERETLSGKRRLDDDGGSDRRFSRRAESPPLIRSGSSSFRDDMMLSRDSYRSSDDLGGTGRVLLVSSLNADKITPYDLFILFGNYGDVIRTKVMMSKRDTGFVQFNTSEQARRAQMMLNGAVLYGKSMKISPSHHTEIKMPRDDDAGTTRDFSNSPMHRFRNPHSKNHGNIFPPSPVLHLCNLPDNIEEKDLIELFESQGFKPISAKFLPKDNKMAFVYMENVEEATEALIRLHDYKLGDRHNLRVSFSKPSNPAHN